MRAPPVRGPHDVPNLRLYLLDRWRPGGVLERAARVLRVAWTLPGDYGWREYEEGDWQRRQLGDCPLWWVSADMVDEITHVAGELPADVLPADVPGLTWEVDGATTGARGLVVLEKPVLGVDARNGKRITVDGFVFGPTRLPPSRDVPPRLGVSLAAYRHVNFDDGLDDDGLGAVLPVVTAEKEAYDGDYPGATWVKELPDQPDREHYILHGEEWAPLGRSDWPLAERLRTRVDRSVREGSPQHLSMMEDRRWLAALHLVADDVRVATVKRVVPKAKHQRRPSERKRLDPTVRVLYLRRLAAERSEASGAADGHRRAPRAHIVRSHPRWQAYGPERSWRKLILVPRHARGGGGEPPAEGPPTVKAVVR